MPLLYRLFSLAAISASLIALPASAAVHTFEAVTATGVSIVFSYDDTAAGGLPDPFGSGGGDTFPALSYAVGGNVLPGATITLYDNFSNGRDYLYAVGGNTNQYLQLEDADQNVFSGNGLSQLAGKTLADFQATPGANLAVYQLPLGSQQQFSRLDSFGPQAAAVPEPSAWWMAAVGGALVLRLGRRRQAL